MATWQTSNSPESTALKQLSNSKIMAVAGTSISDGDTYDFGVQIVLSSWIGVASTNYATVTHSGSVATVNVDSGTHAGVIHAWVKDF